MEQHFPCNGKIKGFAVICAIAIVVLDINHYNVHDCFSSHNTYMYLCHGFVSAGDALGREHPAALMSSFLAGRSGCK